MEGLYLYCIREKSDTLYSFSTKGIDEKHEVFIFPCQELEAVVSEVSLKEFTSEEIQRKSREDIIWVKEKALLHEKIVEEAMKGNDKILSVIPMRFGIIFKGEAKLKEALAKDYSKIKESLNGIRGKQEWSIKVYLKDKEKFEEVIKERSETIKEKEKEISSLPEGMAFFMEEELKETISKETKKELTGVVETIFEDFKKQASASVKNRLLEKELTGRQDPMVLNTAYLIPEENLEEFKREAQGKNQKIQAMGFYLECTGPWPAYNFASYQNHD